MSASKTGRARRKAPARTGEQAAARPGPRRWLRELRLFGLDHLGGQPEIEQGVLIPLRVTLLFGRSGPTDALRGSGMS